MRASLRCALVLLVCALALPACRRRSAPATGAASPPDAAFRIVAPPPGTAGPTLIECRSDACPQLDPGPGRDGGELTIHVEAEPPILNDLVEHDAWSRWILENQVIETLVHQDPWTG